MASLNIEFSKQKDADRFINNVVYKNQEYSYILTNGCDGDIEFHFDGSERTLRKLIESAKRIAGSKNIETRFRRDVKRRTRSTSRRRRNPDEGLGYATSHADRDEDQSKRNIKMFVNYVHEKMEEALEWISEGEEDNMDEDWFEEIKDAAESVLEYDIGTRSRGWE